MIIYRIFKRIFDVLLSLFAIILAFPILLIIATILKFSNEGEVFYLQERVGFKNKSFNIYKFVTMIKNSPNMGTGDVTLRNDPRVTKIGKFLRKSKLNELPQLFNILIGDISIVGPRPLMRVGFERYSNFYQKNVYNVKPGLTGVGSIVFRDEERILTNSKLSPHEAYKEIILPHKGELELWYQKNYNLITDLKIIILTAWIVFFPQSKLHTKWLNNLPKSSKALS